MENWKVFYSTDLFDFVENGKLNVFIIVFRDVKAKWNAHCRQMKNLNNIFVSETII